MIVKLHHIGLVGTNIEAAGRVFEALGLTARTAPQPDPIQKVAASFVPVAEGVFVELLEPTAADSPISGFLKKGGGLHHLCFEVDDLRGAVAELEGRGFQVVSPPAECQGFDRTFPSRAARGACIAFLLSPGRFLIELLARG